MSGSLLLIAAVWLLLLAPLLLRRQSPVRRTSRALAETRVLHRGGSDLHAQRKRPLPAEGHYMTPESSKDDDIEFVDAEPEYVLLDDDSDNSPQQEETLTVTAASYDFEDNLEFTDYIETVDAEVMGIPIPVDSQNSTGAGTTGVVEGEILAAELTDAKADRVADDDATVVDVEAETETVTADANDPDTVGKKDEPAEPRVREISPAYFRGGDVETSLTTPEPIDEFDEAPALEDAEESLELSEEDIAFVASRRGRGVYDPVASQKLMQERLKRRKQVLTALIALTVVALIASVTVGGWLWLTLIASAGFSGLYMFYLRRQAIEEAKLRQRRMARMRRARLGVRNLADGELGVPDRLLRPGAIIVETDEADPELDNLDYASGADYFGEAPETQQKSAPPVFDYDDYTTDSQIRAI